MAAIPVMVNAASPAGADSLNGFYITLGPNIQNTKVDKTTTLGDGAKSFLQRRNAVQADGTYTWAGGLQPSNGLPTITQVDSSESKTGVLPQLTLGYIYPVWRQISLGVEGFYAPKAGSSNIASTTYGASGLLAYNFATQTQAYFKLSYMSMKANLTGSQQFYDGITPLFNPTEAAGGYSRPGDPGYTDPTFKINKQVQGVGVALGARQILPFNIFGSRHLFAGGEISYTQFASKTIASPEYHNPNGFPGLQTPWDDSITNTKISAKQYGANLYIGYRF